MSSTQTDRRGAGVLLPVASLPGPDGCGTLGAVAEQWVAWLREARVSVWQLLPLGPAGLGNSPYSALSSFAGEPLLICTDRLVADGWLRPAVVEQRPALPADRIDWAAVRRWKALCLHTAWNERHEAPEAALRRWERFRDSQDRWLREWCLFAALRAEHQGRSWLDWPAPLRDRAPAQLAAARERLGEAVERNAFVQFLFFDQLESLRETARDAGIEIWGDLPFYPALDSADVWSDPGLFELGEDRRPLRVAGVPPDAFSASGQLWGNPLYRWDALRADSWRWWVERARAALRTADRIRLDHFRAFEAFWAVPASAATAAEGAWETGPGEELFAALRNALGDLPFIVEDLGHITPAVRQLREQLGLPGMRVLQFAFDDPHSEHLPHRLPHNCVAYTGTHDNDTTRAWFDTLGDLRERVLAYVGGSSGEIAWGLVRCAFTSGARWAVAPVQDLLGLGVDARVNEPGRPDGQWAWRLAELPDPGVATRLARLVEASERAPRVAAPPESA